jgi:transposase
MDDDIEKCPVCGCEVEVDDDTSHISGEILWCPSCLWEEKP